MLRGTIRSMKHTSLTLGTWVRATWYGWLLGVPLVIAFALVGENLGMGGRQVLVGLGMGTGVGLLQSRAIRSVLPRPAAWLASCILGLGIPFLVTDVATTIGADVRYSLPLAVAAGGLLMGVWQAFLLRRHVRAPAWWILASAVGWTLAAGVAYLADAEGRGSHVVRGIAGALLYLGTVAAGGLILGFVTGVVLPRLARNHAV